MTGNAFFEACCNAKGARELCRSWAMEGSPEEEEERWGPRGKENTRVRGECHRRRRGMSDARKTLAGGGGNSVRGKE